jgi:hypothetical protein
MCDGISCEARKQAVAHSIRAIENEVIILLASNGPLWLIETTARLSALRGENRGGNSYRTFRNAKLEARE